MKPLEQPPTLRKHFSRYAIGNVLMLLAGFVSFPVTTRYLTAAEFGVLGYWEVWVLFLCAILKLGAGDAMMRFFPRGLDPSARAKYNTHFILIPFALSGAAWLVIVLGTGIGSALGWFDRPAMAVLSMVSVLIAVWCSHAWWYLATRELSGLNMTVSVASRWAAVAATLFVLVYVAPSATAVVAARVVVGLIVMVWLVRWILKHETFVRQPVDRSYALEGMRYGIPLSLREISNIVLVLINRVMLKWLDGNYERVGIYTIGFSLATYFEQIISTALAQALNPVTTRVYESDGPEAVRAVKLQALRPLLYVCCGLGVALVACGRDFIIVIASADKVAATPVFVIAGCSYLAQAVISTAGIGLLLVKRSGTLFALTAVAAVGNVGLNYVLIPSHGLMGATVATCFSQLALQCAVFAFCPSNLRCWPPLKAVVLAALWAVVFVGACTYTDLLWQTNPLLRVLATGILLVCTYALPIIACDSKLRAIVMRRGAART